jgi:hypothetical protein
MEIHFKIAGILLIALAIIHVIFPKYFNWAKEFSSLSLVNRQIIHVHTFFIALMVFLMGLLCLTSAKELTGTAFGKRIALGLGAFWTIRLFIQLFGYSSKLWKGKRFETGIHVLFLLLWAYLSVIFLVTYFS